ncbi:GNAT family N-acetyltransferase [Chryseomicrobium sp. FSL W7-1435]|uniref:GNAT family N-acetyltransferase n=1 Tax=Chryseomicrobium sp. FSL W7-1435 TaxID=2921704 RepID=UPI00315AC5A8
MVIALKVQTSQHYQDALHIRRTVFIEEQGVPAHLEIDEFEDSAIHFVAYEEDQPIGAGRFREYEAGIAKVERICVLPNFRGKNVGNALMDEIESSAKLQGYVSLKLNSQSTAIPFYEKRGYLISSPEFMDAGIPHRAMTKEIK